AKKYRTLTPIHRHEASKTMRNMPVFQCIIHCLGEKPSKAITSLASEDSDSPKIKRKTTPATITEVRAGMNKADLNTLLSGVNLELRMTAKTSGTGINMISVHRV